MWRPCRETGNVVLFVGFQIEQLLLSSSMNSSVSTPLCLELYSLIFIQEKPTARDLQFLASHVQDQTPALLESGAYRDSLFIFFIKVLKDERKIRKKMLMPSTLDYL